MGNTSAPATVKVKIEKASTKVTYADMDGIPAYKAAIRLAEEGIFVGECMGGEYFFNPDTPRVPQRVPHHDHEGRRAGRLEDVTTTGFADDAAIPTWAKGYAASALKAGVVQGAADEAGRIVFNAEDTITRAEAAVLLDRALQVSDVAETGALVDELVPAWAVQSAANLETCGVLTADSAGALGLSEQLTRADAAEMILGALEVLDARDSGGWFNW